MLSYNMNIIDKLRQLMSLDTGMNTAEIELRFEQIAKMLFSCFAIQKGNIRYLFKEIEFYFYYKNHRTSSRIHGSQNLYVGISMTLEE